MAEGGHSSHRRRDFLELWVCSSSSDWGGGQQGGGGGVASEILHGGKGWVRGKEARSGSACSRRFSAGSRGEFVAVFAKSFLHA